MEPFDPDAAAQPGSGSLPFHGPEDASVHVLGVLFDATTLPPGGHGPEAVVAASVQVDLFDRLFGRPWEEASGIGPTTAPSRVETNVLEPRRPRDRGWRR